MEENAPVPLYVRLIGALFYVGPLLFAFGFIAPLTAQIIVRAGITLPGGISPIMVGLALATVWGGIAQYRGRWV